MNYIFLEVEDVLDIHKNQIELYGGFSTIRDKNLLLSAIEMPRSGFGDTYFHKDIFEIAAAYLFHIVQNHPFIDGNKRTGLVCALVFLLNNGITPNFSKDEIYNLVLSVAKGEAGKNIIADFFKKNCKK